MPHVIGIETAIRENRMDDEMMRRIRTTPFIYAPERRQSTLDRKFVALLTSEHLGLEVAAKGMVRCNEVTATMKHFEVD